MGIFSEAVRATPAGRLGRVVNNFNLENPAVKKLAQAIGVAGLKYDSPAVRGTATAHFVIEKYKLAVHVMASGESACKAGVLKRRSAWLYEGYRFFPLKPGAIDNNSIEQIATDIKEILK